MHKIDYDINTDFFETVYNPVKPIKTEFAGRRVYQIPRYAPSCLIRPSLRYKTNIVVPAFIMLS